ncbi:hypothetical protein FIBSPDRAFT_899886 [Athelia psychrophila]|uniref:Uncharacterized protein n=1 Tax=Athelia psychrophila TaxID=1759441 RepID=A0A165Z735_9AGAM|nr:hypothetical protein FIBSPDRAFT_899886 [Fibularhizoctonia sp. CBS 109695]
MFNAFLRAGIYVHSQITSSSTCNSLLSADDQQSCDHHRIIHGAIFRSAGTSKGFVLSRRSLGILTLNAHPPLLGSKALGPVKSLGIISSSTRNPLRFADDQQSCDHYRIYTVLSLDRVELARVLRLAGALQGSSPRLDASSEGLGTDEEPKDHIFFAAQSPPFRR